jgi:hypothetical protein
VFVEFHISEAEAQILAQLEEEAGGAISAGPDFGDRLGEVIRLELFGVKRSLVVELLHGQSDIEEVAVNLPCPN